MNSLGLNSHSDKTQMSYCKECHSNKTLTMASILIKKAKVITLNLVEFQDRKMIRERYKKIYDRIDMSIILSDIFDSSLTEYEKDEYYLR